MRLFRRPPKPFVTNLTPATVERQRPVVTLAESSASRGRANLAPVGVSGVSQFAGLIIPKEYDQAWVQPRRDETILRMVDDPTIGACLSGIEMLVRRVPWYVDPVDAKSSEAKDVAEFYESCLSEMAGFWPGDTMARTLTYLAWGWSALGVQYKRRDDGRIGWEQWNLIPQHTRYGWIFDDRNTVTGLIQLDPMTFNEIKIPLDRLIVFRYGSRDNSPEGSTPLRQCFDAWYRKTNIQIIEGIGIERDLAGLPVMRVPDSDILNNTATYQAAQSIVTNVRQDAMGGLVLASDRDPDTGEYYQTFELVSTAGARAIDTDPIIRRYANEIVTVFLANVMRTGQDNTGSYALSDVQSGLFQQAIGVHLDTIGDNITSQEFPRLARLNGIDPRLVPTLKHGDVESADLARLGTYLVSLAHSGLLADTPELRTFVHDVAGLPVPTVEELKAQAAQEAEEAQKAEQERQDALQRQQQDANHPNDQTPRDEAVSASETVTPNEVVKLVDDDGSLTLTDMMEVMRWWDSVVDDEHKGMLDARIVGTEDA